VSKNLREKKTVEMIFLIFLIHHFEPAVNNSKDTETDVLQQNLHKQGAYVASHKAIDRQSE